ncbi:MAG: hypothetical protein R6V84_09505 [Desulfobacterales bacterium]
MHPEQSASSAKTWILVAAMLAVVFFQGWLAHTVIGDLGQPDWDYRPIPDVYGESAYAMYPALPYPQHVAAPQGVEAYPSKILPIQGVP